MRLDLACPICTAEAGTVEIDAQARTTCQSCGEALVVTDVVQPMKGLRTPPPRQLARRSEAPAKTKVRVLRDGDRVRVHIRMGVITPLMKRIWLTPEGMSTRTWRGAGRAYPLVDLCGFFVLDRVMSKPGEVDPIHLMPCSYFSVLLNGERAWAPLYGHKTRADAIYLASVLNQQLEELRARQDPYRG